MSLEKYAAPAVSPSRPSKIKPERSAKEQIAYVNVVLCLTNTWNEVGYNNGWMTCIFFNGKKAIGNVQQCLFLLKENIGRLVNGKHVRRTYTQHATTK